MHDFLITVLLAVTLLLTFALFGCSNAREPLVFVEPSYTAATDTETAQASDRAVATVPARE